MYMQKVVFKETLLIKFAARARTVSVELFPHVCFFAVNWRGAGRGLARLFSSSHSGI